MEGRIAIVDDDAALCRVVERLLTGQGFKVLALGTGDELRARMATGAIDVLILDVNLAGEDGRALAREVRTRSAVPILMLTGQGSVFDKVNGLESGADDYLTKPFDGQELVARVRALLRRARHDARASAPSTWRFAGWTLHEVEQRLVAPDAGVVDLTSHEFRLLCALVGASGRTLDRDALSKALAGRASGPNDRSSDVLMSKLRRKLAAHGGGELIKTVRGVGYALAAQVERIG